MLRLTKAIRVLPRFLQSTRLFLTTNFHQSSILINSNKQQNIKNLHNAISSINCMNFSEKMRKAKEKYRKKIGKNPKKYKLKSHSGFKKRFRIVFFLIFYIKRLVH